jgi:peptidoglycan/LPS O-acetylase OafA/YrhL
MLPSSALFLVLKDKIPVSRWLFYRAFIVLIVTSIYSSISQLSCYLLLPYIIYYFSTVQSPNWIKNWSKNGDYSFGMFLYGMPISQVIVELMGSSIFEYIWLYVILAWISSLLAGVLSWHLVEKPVSRFKHLFSGKSL